MKIHDMMRLATVRRWGIVATLREQSVAEHTFNVVMISRAICSYMEWDDTEVIKCALDHDLDEAIIGDIPTPTKRRLGCSNILGEESERKEYTSLAHAIVKCADFLEAIHFLSECAYTLHGSQVLGYLSDNFDEYLDSIRDSKLLVAAVVQVRNDLNSSDFII